MTTAAADTGAETGGGGGGAARWFGGNMPIARLGLIINLCVPGAILIWDWYHKALGADPITFAIHTTGDLVLIYLLLSLAVTPLRMVTGWSWLTQFRRALGVFAFYYAIAHLGIYFWFKQGGEVVATLREIVNRIYLTIGFLAIVLMLPLWATSFNGAIRQLGAKNWKWLHRLAYLAAALGGIHYYMQSKADKTKPEIYLAILTGLLLWRYAAHFVEISRQRVTLQARGFPVENLGARPADAAAEKPRFWKGRMAVVGTFEETPTVRTFRLAAADGGVPFRFKAGQFLSLALEIEGKRVTRSYTIASPPTRDGYVELTVKREEKGQVSGFLHEMLKAGHTVEVAAPAGRFTFDASAEQAILLIAGGVGITPVMAILRELTDRSWGGKIDLVFSVRSADEIIFAEELRLLERRHPNLHVHVTITRDAPADWTGQRGRITAEMLRACVADFSARATYICGPDAMAIATRDMLIIAGTPTHRLTLESFTPSAAVASDAGQSPTAEMEEADGTRVTFVRSGKMIQVAGGQTILDAAAAAGVRIDSDCRAGICGTCRCKLVSGRVNMDADDALSAAEKAAGYILACQAHPTEAVTIEA